MNVTQWPQLIDEFHRFYNVRGRAMRGNAPRAYVPSHYTRATPSSVGSRTYDPLRSQSTEPNTIGGARPRESRAPKLSRARLGRRARACEHRDEFGPIRSMNKMKVLPNNAEDDSRVVWVSSSHEFAGLLAPQGLIHSRGAPSFH